MKFGLLLLTALSLAARSLALECYACSAEKEISGVNLLGTLLNGLKQFPPCRQFDPLNPDKRFIQSCPVVANKGCLKITDPNDSSNMMRSCFMLDKNHCEEHACYCNGNLCNSARSVWPSALMLCAALMAAVFGTF